MLRLEVVEGLGRPFLVRGERTVPFTGTVDGRRDDSCYIRVLRKEIIELSPNFGDGRGRSGGGGCGLTVGRLGDDLDPVVECHTENEFWQLVGAVETSPAFLRGF